MQNPLIEPAGDGKWVVRRGFWYGVDFIPKGFKSDLASIPWFARFLLKTANSRFAEAAIGHDYQWLDPTKDRVAIALLFEVTLIKCGVSKNRACLMRHAVELNGFLKSRRGEKDLKIWREEVLPLHKGSFTQKI